MLFSQARRDARLGHACHLAHMGIPAGFRAGEARERIAADSMEDMKPGGTCDARRRRWARFSCRNRSD